MPIKNRNRTGRYSMSHLYSRTTSMCRHGTKRRQPTTKINKSVNRARYEKNKQNMINVTNVMAMVKLRKHKTIRKEGGLCRKIGGGRTISYGPCIRFRLQYKTDALPENLQPIVHRSSHPHRTPTCRSIQACDISRTARLLSGPLIQSTISSGVKSCLPPTGYSSLCYRAWR